jgi:hypothetical protein
MSECLGETSDIEQVIISGGGVPYFTNVIKDYFRWQNLHIVNDTMFSNVRGFQRIGHQIIKPKVK